MISIFLSLLALAAATPHKQAITSINLPAGPVIGTATRIPNQPLVTGLVTAYLAVPYAASPTRYAPPQPTKWTTAKTATKLGPACLQQFDPSNTLAKDYFNNPFSSAVPPESEDCLHLNVYVPPSTGKPKAVMFWLYGGNLAFGSNYVDIYNGASFAVNQDIIVVVPNYRTNAFGFSSGPLTDPNAGFLDQRFALQWVQENIVAFGGDPAQVTIFGESAGAYSVKELLANPPSPLPFRAAIMQSPGYTGGLNPDSDAGKQGYNKTLQDNPCPTTTGLACLREKDSYKLQAYYNTSKTEFRPVINSKYSASRTQTQINNGAFADVPLLIGTNRDEASLFLATANIPSTTDFVDGVRQLLGLDISVNRGLITKWYTDNSTTKPLLTRALTDLIFTCPTAFFSRGVATSSKISSKVYRYRYDASFPNLDIITGGLGAYHSSEIPIVFGTYPQQGSTETQRQLSKNLQAAWASFAKDPASGPQIDGQAWPEFELDALDGTVRARLSVLGGSDNIIGQSSEFALGTDGVCPLYEAVLGLTQYKY